MDYTTNYHLPQWVESDRIMMEDFNEAMAAIDGGIKAVDEAMTQGLAEVTANLGNTGKNARIVWGTYVGTGTSGESQPTGISPGFFPVVAMVGLPDHTSWAGWPTTMIRDCPKANGISVYNHTLNVIWADDRVSWYYPDNAEHQMNTSGKTYYYVVIGYDKAPEE